MKTILLAILLALAPLGAWAADGDPLTGASVTHGSYWSAPFLLCDSKTDVSATCAELDLNQAGAGMPAFFLISRDVTTGCTGNATIAINGQTTTAGVEHVITTLNDTITAVQIAGPHHRFIDADLTGMTGCTDMDVSIILYYERS